MSLIGVRACVLGLAVALVGCVSPPQKGTGSGESSKKSAPNGTTKFAYGAACKTAKVPNPHPVPDETVDYYGACINGRATTGIMVWKIREQPVEIICLDKGEYVSASTVDRFEACKAFWSYVPQYCKVGNYQGQCLNGKPHGVGFESSRGSTISIKSGMFANGQLHGAGFVITKGGCGPAGCSGNLLQEYGWYDQGLLVSSCGGFTECMGSISGKSYVNFLNSPKNTQQLALIDQYRAQRDFDGALAAFGISGDRSDLKFAESVAKTSKQKSQLEIMLLRVAGFDRALDLQARVQNGSQSVSMKEHENLLGFVRGVNSSIPVKVNWSLHGTNAMKLSQGPYKATIKVGIIVSTAHRTCLWGVCQDRTDTDRYVRVAEAELSATNRYRASGSFDLTVSGSSAGTIFGAQTGKTLTDIKPVLQIETFQVKP